MAITADLANDYFETHIEAQLWGSYDDDQRVNAIEFAKNRLQEELSVPKYTDTASSPVTQSRVLDEDTTTASDWPREDLAVYEQALHSLLYSMSNPNGQRSGPKWMAADVEQKREEGMTAHTICERAKHYMGWNFRKLHIAYTR